MIALAFRRTGMIRPLLLPFGLLLALILAHCGGVNEINVAPPRPAFASETDSLESRGSISVQLRATATPLPEHVSSIRFRVNEIRFLDHEGIWLRRLADRAVIRIGESQRRVHPLLATELPNHRFDSVGVMFSDVYVEFGPNSGGPVSTLEEAVVIPASFVPDPVSHVSLTLVYDPVTSVSFDSLAMRWQFRPGIALQVDSLEAQQPQER